MNEPKLATARVDTERLVRELLSALNSLKTIPAPLTCSSPREEERQQRPSQSQAGRSRASKLVGGAPSTISADPRPRSRTPLEALTGEVSDIDGAESEQISAFESAENSETRDYQIEAQSSQHGIIEEFRSDHEVIERLRVTPQELQALSSSSLLGSLTCKQDVLFMLRQLREAPKPAKLQATVPPEPLHVPDENIERSIPDPSEMAERIRRESLAKLTESYLRRSTPARGESILLRFRRGWSRLTYQQRN
jgi:hypothetical protein